jgi:hypothetical protein|nr:MAG TPA: hypothetical protein [Caudoviricetes sp.]
MIQANKEQLQERTRAIISVLSLASHHVRNIRSDIEDLTQIRVVDIPESIETTGRLLGELEEFMHTIREEARAIEAEINS